MGKLFGTDGVRGIANTELTADLAYQLGQAGAYVLTKETQHKPKVLIGKDTRISGDMLEAGLMAGLCSIGAEAILVGVLPTPAIAYLTRLYQADAGIMISASHNSMEYNGIKFFNAGGYKLSDALEEQIESIIFGETPLPPLPVGADLGRVTNKPEALADYIRFAKSTVTTDLNGLKIAIDCANGAASVTAQAVLEQLGATVFAIHNKPDGVNINANCGSTHMDDLRQFTVEIGADVGLAFDGDADRMLAVDELGNIIDGDQIMALCALHMKANGKLPENTLVTTVMSNLGLMLMAKANGLNIKQTKVGDRYVLEEMLANGYAIGGEQSGHIILLEHNTTGDGLISALQLLSVLKSDAKPLSQLAAVVEIMPQVLVNAKVKNENKNAYASHPEIKAAMDAIEQEFEGAGRVLIRPSGTEPLVRVMIEGKDLDTITTRANQLADLIKEKLA